MEPEPLVMVGRIFLAAGLGLLIGLERERQQGNLLEWENHVVFQLATGAPAANLPDLQARVDQLHLLRDAVWGTLGAPGIEDPPDPDPAWRTSWSALTASTTTV